jgi:anti-anti-sigma factor
MGLALCIRPGDDDIIVTVSGEVDVGTEGPLQQVLLRIMRERSARLMLDLSGVSFMDRVGLRAILTTRRRAELHGGFVRLIATPSNYASACPTPLGAIRSAHAGATPSEHERGNSGQPSPIGELSKLASLLESGLLRREEFDRLKARLLADS